MKNWLALLLLVLTGCSWGTYQVPKQDYQQQVQVLGVLPLLVDQGGRFDYPQKAALLELLGRSNAGKHRFLVERLRQKKGYFDVRQLDGAPDLLALSLLSGPVLTEEDGRPIGYHFNPQAVAELAQRNAVDALLVVVFTGAQVEETRRSRNLLESLNTRYNDVMAVAAVVDRSGRSLWQLGGKDAYRALLLQYADFDEAYYNRTELVRVKDISLSGVEQALAEDPKAPGVLAQMYDELFDRVVSGISPSLLDALK